jgi:ribonuclease J
MTFKIHRGTKEIGGSCVEVWTETDRIVIDLGMPLVNGDKSPFDANNAEKQSREALIADGTLPDIPSLYQPNSNTALLISHAHRDHYGLMNHIDDTCPVWLGKATCKLIELTNTFSKDKWSIKTPHYFKNGQSFKVGNIEITPYRMDHAAFDAYAFLIQADGKSLLYSGDFRLHGREYKMFEWFCADVKKNVDYLLLEGTTIGRAEKRFKTESELEDEFIETFRQTNGINLVYVSGQNIDRLKTIYNACHKCSKLFLIDFYTANVLNTLHKLDESIPHPSRLNYKDIRVYFPRNLTNLINNEGLGEKLIVPFAGPDYKFGKDKLDEMADKLVMLIRPSIQTDLERYLHKYANGMFIYSLWSGYKNSGKAKDFLDFIAVKGMPVKDIHTSGHADLNGLRKMVDAVRPKNIVPIHTFEAEEYGRLFPGVQVELVEDKKEIAI